MRWIMNATADVGGGGVKNGVSRHGHCKKKIAKIKKILIKVINLF